MIKNKTNYSLVVMWVLVFLCQHQCFAGVEKSVYSFQEHLSETNTYLLSISGEDSVNQIEGLKIPGRVAKGSISFPADKFGGVIQVMSANFKEGKRSGLHFDISSEFKQVLHFYNVLPGGKLRLEYGIDDDSLVNIDLGKYETANVFVNVWIGTQKVFRLNAPIESGWNSQLIDLDVVAFLRYPLEVTFEVFTDNPKVTSFFLKADTVG